jgi:hydrogenase-4 component F
MLAVVLAILAVPLAAGAVSLCLPARLAVGTTVVSGLVSFGLVLAMIPDAAAGTFSDLAGYLRVDAVSVIFLLATGFLYAAVAVYAVGYLSSPRRRQDVAHKARDDRYVRRCCAGLNVFAWAMLAAPLMGSLALLWIAIEITTIVSALLVALDDTDAAVEAAWKYVLIASSGLGLALLGTVLAYYAGAQVLGDHYDLAIQSLVSAGPRLPATPVRLAFLLATLGFGTKVGLFPVHTWLPDAHSQAPTPVSALLSGALLATSFYAILRFYQVAVGALGTGFPQATLLAFGVASLLLAALYVFGQRDLKRLLAYSSVEHMGILAIGVSFGAPVALAGVLLHVLAHAAAKGNAFMGAGVFTVKYRTKELSAMRGGLATLPWSGPLFLLAIFALSALPPFGLFRSEFEIVAGGLGAGRYAPAAVLVVLVTVAFLGLATAATRMLLAPSAGGPVVGARPFAALGPIPADGAGAAPDASPLDGPGLIGEGGLATGAHEDGAAIALRTRARPSQIGNASELPARGEPSAWMVVPVLAGLAVLVLLGVHPPAELANLITRAAAELRGAP